MDGHPKVGELRRAMRRGGTREGNAKAGGPQRAVPRGEDQRG